MIFFASNLCELSIISPLTSLRRTFASNEMEPPSDSNSFRRASMIARGSEIAVFGDHRNLSWVMARGSYLLRCAASRISNSTPFVFPRLKRVSRRSFSSLFRATTTFPTSRTGMLYLFASLRNSWFPSRQNFDFKESGE